MVWTLRKAQKALYQAVARKVREGGNHEMWYHDVLKDFVLSHGGGSKELSKGVGCKLDKYLSGNGKGCESQSGGGTNPPGK